MMPAAYTEQGSPFQQSSSSCLKTYSSQSNFISALNEKKVTSKFRLNMRNCSQKGNFFEKVMWEDIKTVGWNGMTLSTPVYCVYNIAQVLRKLITITNLTNIPYFRA